ncbi:MAG: PIG-L family deacetylase [Bacteroidia bacterium]|nr:PIG-L family deacetylase [Bacteroidia bacterium]
MIELRAKKVLFLGAHLDDIELGAGGTLYTILHQTSIEVLCVTLAHDRSGKYPFLEEEYHKSMDIIGVPKERRWIENFSYRRLHEKRQEVLDLLWRIQEFYGPEVVFTHSRRDVHQDHQVVVQEALRAFRKQTILGFEITRSSYEFHPQFIIPLSHEAVQRKKEAISQYKSYEHRYYMQPHIVEAQARYHGLFCMEEYGEGFEVLRISGKLVGIEAHYFIEQK